MTIDEAIRAIASECPDIYAQAHAHAAMELAVGYEARRLKSLGISVPYILANVNQWHGERAEEVKKVLRGFLDLGRKQED